MSNKKSRTILTLVMAGLIILLILAGCVNKEKEKGENGTLVPQETPKVVTTSGSPSVVSSSTGGMLEKYDLKQLVSMSDNIIIGEVIDILPSRWNTPDGKMPEIDNNSTSLLIYTDVNIKIDENLKGSLNSNIIVVRTLGGIVDSQGQSSEDQLSYNKNEKVLIFLKKDNDPRTKDVGSEHMITTGLIQGKINILQNNDVVIDGEKMSLDDAKMKIRQIT